MRLFAAVVFYCLLSPKLLAEDSIAMTLSNQGLAAIAEVISEKIGSRIGPTQLPPMRSNVDGSTIVINNPQVSLRIDDLNLQATQKGLVVSLNLSDLQLRLPRIDILRRRPLSCYDTSILIAHQSAIPIRITIRAQVANDQIVLQNIEPNFEISHQNYAVRGPSQCSGKILHNRPLVRRIVERSLWAARSGIHHSVYSKISEMRTEIETKLNELVVADKLFAIRGSRIAPDQDLRTWRKPASLEFSETALKFGLKAGVEYKAPAFSSAAVKTNSNLSALTELSAFMGSLSIHQNYLNQWLQASLGSGSKWIVLDDQLIPQTRFSEILSLSQLSIVFPDLALGGFSSDQVLAEVRLSEAPKILFFTQSQSIAVQVQNLSLRLAVEVEGQWLPFFEGVLDADLAIGPRIAAKSLNVALLAPWRIRLDGRWAEGYQPRNPQMRLDIAHDVIERTMETAWQSPPFYTEDLPSMVFSNYVIGASALRIADERLELEISDLQH